MQRRSLFRPAMAGAVALAGGGALVRLLRQPVPACFALDGEACA